MKFCIQDPQYAGSTLLHETLLNSCKEAVCGGGVYAFVTADGINLFLGDRIFSSFINKGKYTLIVGMDDITSTKALSKLTEMKKNYGNNLEVLAFLHTTKGSTFHPKYSWFRTVSGGILVLGSGNLTQKGLRKNREAFTVNQLDDNGISKIELEWKDWLEVNKEFLKDIDDPIVLEKAEENAKNVTWQRTHKTKKLAELPQMAVIPEKVEGAETEDNVTYAFTGSEENDAWFFESQNEMLLAEIPKSKDRWKQANFDKNTFEKFFGAKCGQNGEYRVLLKNINKAGKMGDTEIRPAVSVASQNYRFELDAASGLAYPAGGRPIGVFVKISDRTFLYELFMPGYDYYEQILAFMNSKAKAGDRMRRIVLKVEECFKDCPNLAIWNNLIDDEEFV